MDNREPGSIAPDPNPMASGWSLAHALDGAARRAKPKSSLGRHLVGYRVAAADEDAADAAALAMLGDDPDVRAAMVRASQSREAAWAHERVSLIARALDDEASRLAADPQKAGKVADHLAPLIELAFAGADAEAPGDYARAIVGREREPLETELLAERAVMSVAATQRAERSGRSEALADELARLKEQPQRWAAAHARQARAIDDLPLDDQRKRLLKGVAARAQANAAAEGLLQQDASWLLEDLDDPVFAGALGTDDAARWRSEAETAIARRAERVAAESAERALLAAADMRAALKRFKDKDDGPLPARAEIVASLGSEAAADEALSATLKGRKHRHAEASVALMAPADEAGWIAAAPDKEARTIREFAAAIKRAAVAGNPGHWLMRHSTTLRELAKDATDDPANLPRLVEQYAALRNQVRGRAAGDVGTDEARVGETPVGAGAPTDDAPLPDEVAAELVEQVLAGDTPQARLDALTKILEGAADGEENAGAATDAPASNRAQADAIAHQLEAMGLPEGPAARWTQLANPLTRRSARLALLGSFAKQIAEEERSLGGENEAPEIVGSEDNDTLVNVRPDWHSAIRSQVNALIGTESIEAKFGQEFLNDDRLELVTETLNAPIDGNPHSQINPELVSSISRAADTVLAISSILAELEEEYGPFVKTAVFNARMMMGGPPKVLVGELVDRSVDSAVNWVFNEYYADTIDLLSRRFQEEFGIDQAEAERWAAAGIFATLTGVGVVFGARDLRLFVRRFAQNARNQLIWAANRKSLAEEPFFTDRPELRNTVEILESKRGTERYTVTLTEIMESRAFRHMSEREKNWLIGMFRQDVLPLTSESYARRLIGPLTEREDFKFAVHYVIQLRNGSSTKPDLVLFANNADPDALHRLGPFLKSVAEGLAGVLEAKGPLQQLSKGQSDLRRAMDQIGRGDSFGVGDLPISEYPPDLLRESVDVILLRYPYVKPEHAYLLADEIRKHFNPELPVWQLLAATSGVLGLIAVTDRDQGDER